MARPFEVRAGVQPLVRFRKHLDRADIRHTVRVARAVRELLAERVVWSIDTTAVGGRGRGDDPRPPLLGAGGWLRRPPTS